MHTPAVTGTIVCHSRRIDNPRVERVYPESVVVAGELTMVIRYTGVTEEGIFNSQCEQLLRIPYQCLLDCEDASGGDPYEISGMDLIGSGIITEEQTGYFNDYPVSHNIRVTEIVRVCVQKGRR